jgi:hypothetical protein
MAMALAFAFAPAFAHALVSAFASELAFALVIAFAVVEVCAWWALMQLARQLEGLNLAGDVHWCTA